MRCRINFDTDPISLTVIAATGTEHRRLDGIGNGNFVGVFLRRDPDVPRRPRIGLREALEESVKLQSHYAEMLNRWDCGRRRGFKTADDWIRRLRELKKRKV